MDRSGDPASRAGTAALLLVAGMVCLTLPLPWQLAAAGFSVAAIVVGVIALVGLRTARGPRGHVLLAVFAITGGGLLTTLEAAVAVTYPLQRDMESCLVGANTRGAQDACLERYESTLEAWRDSVG